VSGVDRRLDEVPEEVLRDEAARWQRSRAGCPDPDLLSVYESELLEGDVRVALAEHLRVCPACASLSADLAALRREAPDALTETAVLERVRRGISPPSWWRAPLAAALLIGCGAAVWWIARGPAASGPPAQAVAPAAAPAPAGPIALWRIEALPVRIPLSSVGVTRSAGANDVSAALVDALGPYQAGRYADAIPALRELAAVHPDMADASLYLGVSCLLANRPQEALAPLERARQRADRPRLASIDWYLAAAEQRSGQTSASRDRLRTLCAAPGEYQQRACSAERTLR